MVDYLTLHNRVEKYDFIKKNYLKLFLYLIQSFLIEAFKTSYIEDSYLKLFTVLKNILLKHNPKDKHNT